MQKIDGTVTGVAEVYLNLSDVVAFTQRIQKILWVLIIISIIIIFCILRITFRYRDAQIATRTKELVDLTKNLEKKLLNAQKLLRRKG